MKTPLILLALGLTALVSLPVGAADDYPAATSYPSESATPVDSDTAMSKDQDSPAGAPSSETTSPEAAPTAPMGGDTMNSSEEKPAMP